VHITPSDRDSLNASLATSLFTGLPSRALSPLMLSDRLITMAEDADQAGFPDVAMTLIGLAHIVLDERLMQ
jgi:hypothetical protein